jgi:hypothetical protein
MRCIELHSASLIVPCERGKKEMSRSSRNEERGCGDSRRGEEFELRPLAGRQDATVSRIGLVSRLL